MYALIEQKVRDTNLPRDLAAIALASDYRINISRYATPDQLAEIRQAARATPVPGTVVTSSPTPASRGAPSNRGARRGVGRNRRRGTIIFVVHGRHERLRNDLFAFLRSVGLRPLEWRKALEITGKPSPYVSEVLEAAFEKATAVIVLLTPDDEARLRPSLLKPGDPPWEKDLMGQPRPNVLFEAGMAFGSHQDSTVLVRVGDIRPFSDVAGRHVVHLTGSPESRVELVTKLRSCGCEVDDSGSDWLGVGDFTLP